MFVGSVIGYGLYLIYM